MLKTNFAKLIKVKSIVTLLITLIFCYLSVVGSINSVEFMEIFKILIVFYFGSQVGKQEAKEIMQDEREAESKNE